MQKDQIKEYSRRILKVLIYIEDHIDEEMTLSQVAKVACYSVFHFNRIFHAIVGETVHQYVKRLRMERAARRLRYTEIKVTEIALEASYDTPSAFTKAFKQSLGKSPRDYREVYSLVHSITKKVKELPMIKPDKIEKIKDMDLLFIRRYGNYTKTPWDAWKAMITFLNENHLDRNTFRFFGISHDDPNITSEEKLRYDACILTQGGIQEKGELGKETLKGGKYAIFTHNGPYEGLAETADRILLKWLPDSKEAFDETRPLFCEYFHMEFVYTDPNKLTTKIYVPLM